MHGNYPLFAHRVTVFGSTANSAATSAGVSIGSTSGLSLLAMPTMIADAGLW